LTRDEQLNTTEIPAVQWLPITPGGLFSPIPSNRNLYNIDGETNAQFRIPNYNGEQRFLEGNTSARAKSNPGVPEIYGTFGVDNSAVPFTSGAFWTSRGGMGGAGRIALMILKHPFEPLGYHQYTMQATPSSTGTTCNFSSKIPITLKE
jgi:hypothetical protein